MVRIRPLHIKDAEMIACCIVSGIDKHYSEFLQITRGAKSRFERAQWTQGREESRRRIALYNINVRVTVNQLLKRYDFSDIDEGFFKQVKSLYIDLLYEHQQPELAETFYNSVLARLLHYRYYHNANLFVRPCISTQFIDTEEPVFSSFYPTHNGWIRTIKAILTMFDMKLPYENIRRDITNIARKIRTSHQLQEMPYKHFQVQVINSLFFRNKAAYIVGRVINAHQTLPFVMPVLNNGKEALYVNALLIDETHIANLFNFAWTDFMVDCKTPAAIVQFLAQMLPSKLISDIYTAIGLRKQAKSEFYRLFLSHLNHSDDQFVIAPGTKGMVMTVFTLTSFPYVFKVINDTFAPPKEVTPALVREKYWLVRDNDRVGRMADSLHFVNLSFPVSRFHQELLDEMQRNIRNSLEIVGDMLIISAAYVERRLYPLDLYLQHANEDDFKAAVIDYGHALKDLIAANIFPGDLLLKNFGVSRHGRVVFYDYDEVEFITSCNFRPIPEPIYPEQELSAEPWYPVRPNDVFPEEFESLLLADTRVRSIFLKHHAELLDYRYWQEAQEHIRQGVVRDVYSYPIEERFISVDMQEY